MYIIYIYIYIYIYTYWAPGPVPGPFHIFHSMDARVVTRSAFSTNASVDGASLPRVGRIDNTMLEQTKERCQPGTSTSV